MDLKTYLKTHKQVDLARAVGVTTGAVHQWANGMIAIAIERCVPIERATSGLVTRRDLRPDDWADIWPELAVNYKPNPTQTPASSALAATESVAQGVGHV